MKWINHMLVTGSIVYAVTADPLLAVYSIAGSVIPDKLEGKPPKTKKAYWRWRQKHRTWTHWPVPYLSLIVLILLFRRFGLIEPSLWPLVLIPLFILTGALLHIVEDALCGKVPLISHNKKIGLKIFTVDSFGEYFFSISLIIILLLYRGCSYILNN
ncbi:metal-dependent hydrolase [Pectinatus cerevisiiphilus]|uniref:Inner membrane protein n=1 Tax=Pectinatus cerevisiiphilus TaxID=86956 RepID=A0A4R3KBM4_9FIRM|nr:metal-dependent hydrolase [Pectinatus cerevisiiphilus]TCS80576.1 inner membrane protein [Pectinatus cerevisiiphilus]